MKHSQNSLAGGVVNCNAMRGNHASGYQLNPIPSHQVTSLNFWSDSWICPKQKAETGKFMREYKKQWSIQFEAYRIKYWIWLLVGVSAIE